MEEDKKIFEVVIVTDESSVKLKQLIKHYLQKDYTLYGNMIHSMKGPNNNIHHYCQMMVKYEKE